MLSGARFPIWNSSHPAALGGYKNTHCLYWATSVGLEAAHLTGVPSVLGRAGAALNRVGGTTRPRVTGLLQAHLPEAESLALGEVQGSDPQANQARQNPHQFLSRDGPVGDGMAPVSLQITDWLFTDTYRGKERVVLGQTTDLTWVGGFSNSVAQCATFSGI